MGIEVEEVLDEEINKACETRRGKVRDFKVYKKVIELLIGEMRSSGNNVDQKN